MKLKNAETVVLYLEEWQKRMVSDFLGIDCETFQVDIGQVPDMVLRYGLPTGRKHKRMYFTDWQMREMRDEAGVACEFIELSEEVISLLRAGSSAAAEAACPQCDAVYPVTAITSS